MRHMVVENVTRSYLLAGCAEVADTFLHRFRGLMGRRSLAAGEGLILNPTNAVHSFGMRFSIDVIHADRQGTVLRLLSDLAPNRIGPIVRQGRITIELPAGTIARSGTKVGDTIRLSSPS